MAKTSIKQKRFLCRRLLTFLVLLNGFFVNAKTPSPSAIRRLTVEPDSQAFFTAQENGFTLKIPGTDPLLVQTDLPQLPEGIQLITSKKEEFVDEKGERGTLVHLWFTFKETGPVRLPPLIVIVDKRTFYLPFGDVNVFENPNLISPQLLVDFISGAKLNRSSGEIKVYEAVAGQEIIYELELKYFSQILSFDWQLPKDSLFKELNRSDYARGKTAGRSFSDKALSVAQFSWKPLVPGEYIMPQVTISAVAYNGSTRTLNVPRIVIKVVPEEKKQAEKEINTERSQKVFSSAFTQKQTPIYQETKSEFSKEDSKKLAELRTIEKNSLALKKARAERADFELLHGLSGTENEVKLPLVRLFFILTFCFIFLTILFAVLRKKAVAVVFLIFAAVFTVFSAIAGNKVTDEYAIFAGGNIMPVPEEASSAVHKTEGGLRVKIVEKTGDWFYITANDVNGWTKKENIYEIK